MRRSNDIAVPPLFSEIAEQQDMGALVQAMSGGSRLQAWRDKSMVIAIYQEGSVVGQADNLAPFDFRYDEVTRFAQHLVKRYVNQSYRGTTTTCFFWLADGRSQRLQGKAGPRERNVIDDLREFVDPRIAAAQLPRMLTALRQGKSIPFGAYALGPRGLTTGTGRKEKHLPWAEVEDVAVEHGFVRVTERGRRRQWAAPSTVSVPNLTAFLALVREARGTG